MEGDYLNVDLDVAAAESLAPLIAGFGDTVIVLHESERDGLHCASFELADLRAQDADAAIQGFCDLIAALPEPARRCWERCARREFNAGYEGRAGAGALSAGLSSATLARAVAVGAGIGFTAYWHHLVEAQPPATPGAGDA